MTGFNRWILAITTVALTLPPPALHAARPSKAPSLEEQEIDDILELLPPARKGEPIIVFFDRLAPRMTREMRLELPTLDFGKDWWKQPMPPVRVNGRDVTFGENKRQVRMKVQWEKGQLTLWIEGRAYQPGQYTTIKSFAQEIEPILKSKWSGKTTGWYPLWMPEARAQNMNMMGTMLPVMAMAGMMFLQWNNRQKTSQNQMPPATCAAPVCCVISTSSGGAYMIGSPPYCCQGLALFNPGSGVYLAGSTTTNCSGYYPPAGAPAVGTVPATGALPPAVNPWMQLMPSVPTSSTPGVVAPSVQPPALQQGNN